MPALFAAALAVAGLSAFTLAAAELKPWVGRQPAQFQLKDLSGSSHRLADYRGKVVLVNFWATWCEPCRDEMPAIEKLKARLSGRPFVVLAISYCFFGLDSIGDELEQPFGSDINDLPLKGISRAIERNLRQRIGEEIPPPVTPHRGVLT